MRRFAFLAVAPAFLVAGCFTLAGPPPAGYESDPIACADGLDNDQDGQIDCQDSDCLEFQFCGEQIVPTDQPTPETTYSLCTDGIDNDDDGHFDCGDTNCQAIMELCCQVEVDNISCSDLDRQRRQRLRRLRRFQLPAQPLRHGVLHRGRPLHGRSRQRRRPPDRLHGQRLQHRSGVPSGPGVRLHQRVDDDGDGAIDCADSDCATDPAYEPAPRATAATASMTTTTATRTART